MQEYIPEFACKWKIILQADGYYFSTRYPGDTAFLVAKEDVDECWEAVEETRASVQAFIKTHQYKGTPIDEERT